MTLPRADKKRVKSVAGRLGRWFVSHGREFPWREQGVDLYRHVCVEVLVQRTRAETVARFYGPFFERFPSWKAIDDASIGELEGFLKPVGLWQRRARSLKNLARYAEEAGGIFPADEDELLRVPAVGQYVANAILLFQEGRAAPLLDTNMARVLERYLRPRKLADIRHDPWLQEAAWYLVGQGEPREINWAILDLGAVICAPRNPKCSICPLGRGCSFKARQQRLLNEASR